MKFMIRTFDDLSTERLIQPLLQDSNVSDINWGWVVYRNCYKPEFDAAWESVKSATKKTARRRIATSDPPDITEKMDWVFVEDRENLDGASCESLDWRFQDWVCAENPGWHMNKWRCGHGSRYMFYIQVDEPALRSIATGDSDRRPYVNLVPGWEDEGSAEGAEAGGRKSCLKIPLDKLNLGSYVEADGFAFVYFGSRI